MHLVDVYSLSLRSVDEYDVPIGEPSHFHGYSVVISFLKFVGIFIGSFVLGCVVAMATALFLKMSKLRDYPLLETSLFMLMSYSAFLIAEASSLSGKLIANRLSLIGNYS